jgi:hypothetical protein
MVMPRMPFSAPSGPVPGMGQPAALPPMAAPSPPAAPPLPSPSQPDLMGLLDKLLATPAQPKYPPGYKKPKKPERAKVLERAQVSKQAYQPYLDDIADTYRRMRFQVAGYLTETDRLARSLGGQTAYVSSALRDAFNRAVAYHAARPIAWSVDEYDPDKASDSQKIEDFSYYLRKKFERSWVERGNRALKQDEAWGMLLFGMLAARVTPDLTNTHCPFDFVLKDPCTVYPVWGRAGAVKTLESVYCITKMPAQQVLADYFSDDPPAKVMEALKPHIEATMGRSAEVEVVEYWDTWWRGVFIQSTDVDLVPITEHKYGCVPFIIQYGPGGEPMYARSPDESWSQYDDSTYMAGDKERTFKSAGFVGPMKLAHDQREGFGARVQEAVLKGFNPPKIVETTAAGADGYEPPEIDTTIGGTTYLKAGEERVQAVPTSPPAADASLLMTMLGQDAQTNLLNPGFSNAADKSNISGTARSSMAEEGREEQSGWDEALELFRGRVMAHAVKLWRNFGHLSRYGTGKKQPLYIPRRNPGEGESRSYELTPDVIDNVDCDVICTMNGLRLSEMIPFGQAAQMFGPDGLGIWDMNLIAQKAGVTDLQRIQANNRIHRAVRKAEDLEEFAKIFSVPQGLIHNIKIAGTPEEAQGAEEALSLWMQAVVQPMMAQLQQSMQPPAPPGAAPPGTEAIGGIPGGPNTAAAVGQLPGPGSGPQGPTGNPSPPPPGSYRIEP